MGSIGLYIHIPFCRAKCAYCDFNSYANMESLHERYVQALCLELRAFASACNSDFSRSRQNIHSDDLSHSPPSVDTIYIGGGTPTMLPPALLEQILMMCRDAFAVAPKAEISLEANPGTVTIDNLHRLRTAGVNRLSLGAQSFRAAELRLLQRIHSADQIGQAFQMARAAGFDNVNLDLIYGLPGQTLADWEFNLEQAFALKPEHLSLYALSVEEGTPLANRIASGLLPQPDPDLAAEMYSLAEERLASASYAHYELSNWASLRVSKDSVTEVLACRHNLKHWRVQPYLGFGAGAHSYYGGYRYSNVLRPEKYISRIERGSSPVEERHAIGPAESMAETMILGLRLTEGVRFADFRLRHGRNLCAEYATELSELEQLGLLVCDKNCVRLTARGRLLANQVFVRFWPPRRAEGAVFSATESPAE